ncbi:MAG: sigma-70 family RNA polymerase sigma factor [Verrucomicrobiales bacterium]|nr:sigma-70 family RNA polymerase sigma factor [Verrucomicrobiales bacterium]
MASLGLLPVNPTTGPQEPAPSDLPKAADLIPAVYSELRRLAAAQMANQPAGQTLQATALVHEAWLKLAGKPPGSWSDREHFFRAAAEAMRHILIDRARSKQRLKRGAQPVRVDLQDFEFASEADPESILLMNEALESLAHHHPVGADLVKLRYFLGLSMEETAVALGISEKSVQRQWIHTRAWLFRELTRLMQAPP